jgi:enoyl-CoA hydratase
MTDILLDKNGVIATVTLSNPNKRNALNVAMWRSLAQTFHQLSQDESLRCVILRGAEGHFSAGADISEFPVVRNDAESGKRYHMDLIAGALEAVNSCLHPTIAAIEGVCIGGGLEIACACDLRIASNDARLGIPTNRLGFPLAPIELRALLHLLGKAATLEILLEGRIFDAAEAKEKGLLHKTTDNLTVEVQQTAERIAQGAPLAARVNKQLVRRLSPPAAPLSEHDMSEAFAFLATQDYREGIQSFLEKRPPAFQGK